jgi:hypothetical protein
LLVGAVACSGHSAPVVAIGSRVQPAIAAAMTAADHARAPWRCAALDTPALDAETIQLGTAKWMVGGHTFERAPRDSTATIAVIADAGGAAPTTIAALGRLRERLDAAAPQLVLALGGMGTTQVELEATLGAIAEHAPWPVIALPGDLEDVGAQTAAIAALRARGATVLDGRLVRWIEIGGATIGTVPGGGDAGRLVAGDDGCGYTPGQVTAVLAELTARPGLRILATAEAPRDPSAPAAVATGELALSAPAAQPIDVVLHGPSDDAASPARTGGRDGAQIALTPGSSDATTRLGERLTATHAPPSVGVLTIRDATWRWKPLAQ